MLSAIGIGVGGVIAFAASGLLRTLLYEVSRRDPLVFIGSSIAVAAIAIAG